MTTNPNSPSFRPAKEGLPAGRRPSPILAAVLVLAFLRVRAQLEVLGALDGLHPLRLALGTLELEHDLLGCLRLLVEHGLRLPAEAGLLLVVTSLALGADRGLARLVLGHLVRGVLLALAAVGVAGLRDVHHRGRSRARVRLEPQPLEP